MSRYNQTGGNMEPLPFMRKWGAALDDNGEEIGEKAAIKVPKNEPREMSYGKVEEEGGCGNESEVLKKVKKEHSSKRSRSRSAEHKKRKKRSRSREGKHKKHSSRSRSRSKDRKKRSKKESGSRSGSKERESKGSNPLAASLEAARKAAALIAAATHAGDGPKPTMPIRGSGMSQLLEKQETDVKSEAPEDTRERKRKSRWSTAKSFVPGMPTILPSNIDDNQRAGYLLQMEIEETTRQLRLGDFTPAADVESFRSPSPEPVYDANGKRLNTREVRKRQELEQRRHEKIQALLRLNMAYKPPADYRAPNIRLHDKVWIPQEDHPEINFVGLLIGPRGNTLKSLEAETGAKIIIRGKGSVKEGKLGRREGPLPGEHEPLHAYITGTDHAVIKRGCDKIREIINAALMIPDGQNELRKLQLRELAVLNGTLRPEDLLGGTRCSNCGSDQHKTWECPDALNVTANVICTACGGAGHIARDCKNPRPGFQFDGGAGMDDEYSALMAELGEKTPNTSTNFGANNSGVAGTVFRPQYAPRYRLPGGAPIVRVNLSQTREHQPGYWATGDMPPPFFPPVSGYADPSTGSPQGWPGMPWPGAFLPVPPPPGSLSVFPPPPPPPPPAPKLETDSDEGNLNHFLNNAPAPPPPPPS